MDKIYFRADMNQTVATGHIMRCLSIADGLKEIGVESVFISADNNSKELVNNRGYEVIILNTDWQDMEGEIGDIRNIIKRNEIKTLIIDSYYATKKYLEEVTKLTRTIYIDDFNRSNLCVDAILAYTVYADEERYKNLYKQCKTGFLIGTDYVPMRKDFRNIPRRIINKDINNILVLSGGSDSYNIIEKCIDELYDEKYESIIGICGKFYKDTDRLRQKYEKKNNIIIFENVSNIKEMMLKADFCVSAAGSTLYELCACGTPTVSYVLADNQIDHASKFSEKHLIPCLGDIRKKTIEDELQNKIKLFKDYTYRKEISERMQLVVDGNGAIRIANYIMDNDEHSNYYSKRRK